MWQTFDVLENTLLNAAEICTDATVVKTDGKQNYIRNFSTENTVLYCSSEKKDLDALTSFPLKITVIFSLLKIYKDIKQFHFIIILFCCTSGGMMA